MTTEKDLVRDFLNAEDKLAYLFSEAGDKLPKTVVVEYATKHKHHALLFVIGAIEHRRLIPTADMVRELASYPKARSILCATACVIDNRQLTLNVVTALIETDSIAMIISSGLSARTSMRSAAVLSVVHAVDPYICEFIITYHTPGPDGELVDWAIANISSARAYVFHALLSCCLDNGPLAVMIVNYCPEALSYFHDRRLDVCNELMDQIILHGYARKLELCSVMERGHAYVKRYVIDLDVTRDVLAQIFDYKYHMILTLVVLCKVPIGAEYLAKLEYKSYANRHVLVNELLAYLEVQTNEYRESYQMHSNLYALVPGRL
jgi:hypothetical protein